MKKKLHKWSMVLPALLLIMLFVSPVYASRECDLKIKAHNHHARIATILGDNSKMRRKANPLFHKMRVNLSVAGNQSPSDKQKVKTIKYTIGNLKGCNKGTLIFKIVVKCHKTDAFKEKIINRMYAKKVNTMPKSGGIPVMDFGDLGRMCSTAQ